MAGEQREWIAANRRLWEARTPHHVGSAFYDVPAFLTGRSTLDDLERAAVGDVAGKRLLHLQCHFGLDSLSWAREGAEVTGVDFSGEAVAVARRLSAETGVDATFVEGDVLDPDLDLGSRFDVVFASWGALCWLPDLDRWAATVARHLVAGGRLAVVDQHSAIWPWDDADGVTDLRPRYPYFLDGRPLEFCEPATYAEPAAEIGLPEFVFNHGLGEIVTAVAEAGLVVERLEEHPVLAWQGLPFMVEGDERRDGRRWWRLPGDHLPLSFSLRARRP